MSSKWTEEQIFVDKEAKNKIYGTCYVIKKSKLQVKSKKNKFFAFILLLMVSGICYFIVNISTNIINVNSEQSDASAIIKAQNYYAVSIAQSQDASFCQKVAKECKMLGGAGYVYANQGQNYVLVSAYKEEDQAQRVKEKLIQSNYQTTSVVPIVCEQKDYSNTIINNKINKKDFASLLAIFSNAFDLFNELAIKVDTGVISCTESKSSILSLYNKYEPIYNSLKFLTTIKDEQVQTLIKNVQEVFNLLKSNSDIFVNQDYFSANLKYSSIKTALCRFYL